MPAIATKTVKAIEAFETKSEAMGEFKEAMEKKLDSKTTSVSESCKLLSRLSGLSVAAYAKEIEVSHTYWKELETGVKDNPSMKVKKRIAQVSGLSIGSIDYLLKGNHPGSENIYRFIIDALEIYLTNLMPKKQ